MCTGLGTVIKMDLERRKEGIGSVILYSNLIIVVCSSFGQSECIARQRPCRILEETMHLPMSNSETDVRSNGVWANMIHHLVEKNTC